MVIVVGKEGRGIPQARAMEYIAGFTVAHDVSARDWQLKKNGAQWLMGKTFDGYAPIGPAIVTTDSFDPANAGIRCFVNGKTVQDSSTENLVSCCACFQCPLPRTSKTLPISLLQIFKTEFLIEWISKHITLKPGDLILTGTPPGVGCFRKPPVFLKSGDVCTVEIDGIGSITNTVRSMKTSAKL